jgi:HAD superfamily hydrolase (TIGR01458 family)
MSPKGLRGLKEIGGLLLDIDGTLLIDDRAVRGAPEALGRLLDEGLRTRLLTNTSRRSRAAISAVLAAEGFAFRAEDVLTPAVLARRLILDSGRRRAALLVPPEALEDFAGIEDDRRRPDWVVLGDLGPGFTHDVLNTVLRLLRSGAVLVALHRNRSWRPPGQDEALDVGAYVAALEFASGTSAITVGKPSLEFFRLALEDIGLPPAEVLVVGDDPEADVEGARAAGCRTALVRTGRFQGGPDDIVGPGPDLILDSIADLQRAAGG